jgi:MFS family permease
MARFSDQLYETIFDETEDRACTDISESECREAPRNFTLNVANGAATKLGEKLASPDLTIPWMLSALGVPPVFSGLLVPVRRAGSLLPQLAASGMIRRVPVRKRAWVGAGIAQTLSLAFMALAAAFLSGVALGVSVTVLMLLFSVASGIESVAYKDVLAKTTPKGKRGRLLAARSTIGGALTLGAGLILFLGFQGAETRLPYIILIAGAALLFGISVVLFSRIYEEPGATDGGRTPLAELKQAWEVFRQDAPFRRFVGARILLLTVALVQPFYVLISRAITGESIGALGSFVIASGVGGMLGGPLWGKLADRNANRAMVFGGLLATAVAAYALLFQLFPEQFQRFYLLAPVFVINAIAYAGIRLGRKTWLVDYAPAAERPLYVSLANTLVGAGMLAGSLLGVLAQFAGPRSAILVSGLLLLTGSGLALSLPSNHTEDAGGKNG